MTKKEQDNKQTPTKKKWQTQMKRIQSYNSYPPKGTFHAQIYAPASDHKTSNPHPKFRVPFWNNYKKWDRRNQSC